MQPDTYIYPARGQFRRGHVVRVWALQRGTKEPASNRWQCLWGLTVLLTVGTHKVELTHNPYALAEAHSHDQTVRSARHYPHTHTHRQRHMHVLTHIIHWPVRHCPHTLADAGWVTRKCRRVVSSSQGPVRLLSSCPAYTQTYISTCSQNTNEVGQRIAIRSSFTWDMLHGICARRTPLKDLQISTKLAGLKFFTSFVPSVFIKQFDNIFYT